MKLKDVILSIAIIIMTIFVTYYGINTIYPSPDYNNFCSPDRIMVANNSNDCYASGGKWMDSASAEPKSYQGYCDFDYYCRQEFENASKIRSRDVFIMAIPIGIAVIATGAFFFGLEAVGAGLMGGGVGTLVYGSGAYWPYTENLIRFLISLAGLLILIFFAYFIGKKFGKKKNYKR